MPFVNMGKSRLINPVYKPTVKQRQCFPILRNCARARWQLPALKMIRAVTPAKIYT